LPRREIAPSLKENGVPAKGQRAFDAQEAVFARGWDFEGCLEQDRHESRLNWFNETQEYGALMLL
jgi:hypothetical protein